MINGTSRQLKLNIDGKLATAEYVSGAETKELIFKYVSDQGEIAVSVENYAVIDTVYGKAFDTKKDNNKLYTIANITKNPSDEANEGRQNNKIVYTTPHFYYANGDADKDGSYPPYELGGAIGINNDFNDAYHTFGINWLEDRMVSGWRNI